MSSERALTYDLDDLVYLMRRLRDPDTGCPWDIKQTYKTVLPSTIEEAYEVADAIEREDLDALKEELGDYLFQAIFYCQMATEEERFDIYSVIDALVKKLVRRHPHVFPEGALRQGAEQKSLPSSDQKNRVDQNAVNKRWEEIKQQERATKGLEGVFDDVPKALPALLHAQKTQKRAAKQKFDWTSLPPVYEKLTEEMVELQDACNSGDQGRIEDELGDVLFSCVNISRHIKVDAETALRRATNKFQTRFLAMQALAEKEYRDRAFEELSIDEMEALWQRVKY